MVQFVIRLDPGGRSRGAATGAAAAADAQPVRRPPAIGRALWLAPDEWLVLAPAGMSPDERPRWIDVSAHRTLLEIRGGAARDLLARGCPLDLDSRTFAADHCAQTLLARVDVILFRFDPKRLATPTASASSFRSSFARYLVDWLRDAIEGLES